ncbi:hypothetical protein H4R99_002734 [Coemansia sp. RSA 1722]|nr:hypothetical protein H4R99_002734 [Coemansia sp. RSA 1722]
MSASSSASINPAGVTSTPSHPSRGSGRGIPELGQTEKQYSTVMKKQAQRHIGDYLRTDIKGVLELSRPVNKDKAHASERTINTVVQKTKIFFEEFDNAVKLQQLSPPEGSARSVKDDLVKERDSYKPLTLFISKVANAIQKGGETPSRLLIPHKRTDTAMVNAETNSRVDIALKCIDVSSQVAMGEEFFDSSASTKKQREDKNKAYYEDIFAIIEVKRYATASDQASAFEQLVRYTREVYDKQHNRRFAWGLTICGFELRICLFGSNYILASEKFDLQTDAGKQQLIRLLVYWSFCEDHRLGYDPTIRRLEYPGCWEIDVPSLNAPEADPMQKFKVETFYSNTVIVSADRQFGRLTRCFLASRQKPESNKQVGAMKHDVIIKDAWPESEKDANDDKRDEVAHLKTIHTHMPKGVETDGTYPTLEAGGRVCFSRDPHSSESEDPDFVEDNTSSLLGDILVDVNKSESSSAEAPESRKKEIAYRVHKRIATSPIGEPLRRLDSILELIIIVADVMRAHHDILENCKILHRDISNNNVMFSRTEEGSVKGLLIDFDHAIGVEPGSRKCHQQRSGTLPFMSVNNLENNGNKRTSLDDWESLIYLLCWIGTFGLRNEHAPDQQTQESLHIGRWTSGTLETIARSKRTDLDSEGNFANITSQFYEDSGDILFLANLVETLRRTLIDREEKDCKGANILKRGIGAISLLSVEMDFENTDDLFKKARMVSQKPTVERIDPFKNRADNDAAISEKMLVELEKHAKLAKDSLRNGYEDFPISILSLLLKRPS